MYASEDGEVKWWQEVHFVHESCVFVCVCVCVCVFVCVFVCADPVMFVLDVACRLHMCVTLI